MGLEVGTAALLSSLVGAGTSAFQAHRAGKAAKKTGREAEEAAEELKRKEERNKLQAAMRLRRKGRGTGKTQPRPTILTSPLGTPGQGTQGGKTLLGL